MLCCCAYLFSTHVLSIFLIMLEPQTILHPIISELQIKNFEECNCFKLSFFWVITGSYDFCFERYVYVGSLSCFLFLPIYSKYQCIDLISFHIMFRVRLSSGPETKWTSIRTECADPSRPWWQPSDRIWFLFVFFFWNGVKAHFFVLWSFNFFFFEKLKIKIFNFLSTAATLCQIFFALEYFLLTTVILLFYTMNFTVVCDYFPPAATRYFASLFVVDDLTNRKSSSIAIANTSTPPKLAF